MLPSKATPTSLLSYGYITLTKIKYHLALVKKYFLANIYS